MMDFFAARHFALTIQWSGPINELSLHVLSIRGLDFVLLISAAVGIISSASVHFSGGWPFIAIAGRNPLKTRSI